MPRAERRAGDVFCSLECEFEYSEREANEAAKRRATSAITKAYRTRARALLFERDDWTCYLCGVAVDRADVWPSPGSAVLDHVIPRAKLGLTHPSNLKTAHAACNNQKKDMDLDVYLALVAGPLRRPSLIS
jgi:5-methylcytosine-specific restriction endonuclease McrA